MADIYKAKAKCSNCDFKGEVVIEKGIPVEKKECPKCGCVTLVRIPSVKSRKYYSF